MLTAKEQAAELLMFQVDVVMRYVCTVNDGLLLEEVVAKGPEEWRKHFVEAFRAGKSRPLAELDELANRLFYFFSKVHIWRYGSVSAKQIVDRIEEVTPPTEKEIAEAWVLDSSSSEDGRRYFYGDKHPEELIRSLRAGTTVH